MFDINWNTLWEPTHSLVEIFIRGSIVYLALFVLLRVLRRESGGVGIADVLFIVLVADATQNAMATDYRSITEGLVLVGTLAFWDFSLDWLGFRSAWAQRILRPKPLMLLENGRFLRHNMKQEMITEEELRAQLREQGIEDPAEVKKCYLEGDGHISVIPGGKRQPSHLK